MTGIDPNRITRHSNELLPTDEADTSASQWIRGAWADLLETTAAVDPDEQETYLEQLQNLAIALATTLERDYPSIARALAASIARRYRTEGYHVSGNWEEGYEVRERPGGPIRYRVVPDTLPF